MNRIAIHGVPRSGTSWIGSILDSSEHVCYRFQPLFSYAFKSFLDSDSSSERVSLFFEMIANSDDDFLLQIRGKEALHIPVFRKKDISHVVYKEVRYHDIVPNLLKVDEEIRVIGVVRNPKSVIASWYLAPKEFERGSWTLEEEWRDAPSKNGGRKEEFYGYRKWCYVARMFVDLARRYPNRFFLLKYHDLLANTQEVVEELFHFCGITMSEQTLSFLRESQSTDMSEEAYSVYRKRQRDDKWRSVLPCSIVAEIDDDLLGSPLEEFIQ